jgi:hypothetical protein
MSRDRIDPLANVQAMPARPVSDKARRMLGRIEFAGEIKPTLDRPYLIKGWLDRGAVSVVYGDANVGKSFWAIDLAHHVHEGLDWAGCRVKRSSVLYIAAEGGAMFDHRLVARGARFMVLRGPVRLTGGNSDAGSLTDAMRQLSQVHGPFGLIVVDTLARVMGAADENAAPAIADLLASLDLLRESTGAHIMLVHHHGKDAARGARGHSSLRAAIDTEISIARPEGEPFTYAKASKQRDMQGGRDMPFTLQLVTLGTDSDGDPVTTRVVKHEGRAAKPNG